jgi:transposase-like protein
MNDAKFTKEDVKKLIEAYGIKSVEDIQNAMKDLFGQTMQNLLEAELDVSLGYSKHDYSNKETENSRNGYSPKTVTTKHGPVKLNIPRDRMGKFQPTIVKKHQRDVSSIEDKVISLYACGLSTRDIAQQLQDLYGMEISAERISQITDSLLASITEWRNRGLDRFYPVIFIDGMFFKLNDNRSVQKRALYLMIGINAEGMKEVLGMWIDTGENAKGWLDILNDIHNRGVERICFVCADGLPGLEKAVSAVFPQTKLQRCIVHQLRYTLQFVSHKDRKLMARDMKAIYQAATKEIAEENLAILKENWGARYPNSVRSWFDNWDILSTFFAYPKELRTVIYTTNPIESVNRQIRKITKTKGHFPNENALYKIVYLGLMNASKRWTQRMLHWDQIIAQLIICFDDLQNYV